MSFYCFNQYAFNNTHSHIYLAVPSNYDFDEVVDIMKQEYPKLDDRSNPKFDIYSAPVRFADKYAEYSVREFNNDDTNTFCVL